MSPSIQLQWNDWSAQFAARSLRERALMAIGGVVVVITAFTLLALDPLTAQKLRLDQQVAEARTTIKVGDAVIAAGRGQTDPNEVKRRNRDALRDQIAAIDAKLDGLQRELVPPDQVSKLLEGVLSRNRGLSLVSLRKLPVQRLQAAGAAAKQPDNNRSPTMPPTMSSRSIYQHSFEIAVEGSYNNLHSYVAKLEALPWQLFWGKLELDAAAHPQIRLTLTVHTLSLNRAWLVV